MKPDASDKDLAFTAMAMDILSNVLSRADNPGNLGTYLIDEVRELTGARCVLLIECLGTSTAHAHRIVNINPLRRREWAESPDLKPLYEAVHRVPAAQFWHGEDPSEVAGLLRRDGFELSMVFPLYAGDFRVGTMLVLGLPDEEHITPVLSLLNNLSAIMSLVLRNAILYENQEQLVQERTEELQIELTERKRAEEELQFRNILLASQQEVSIDGILVVDENARILLYNHRFVEMMGLPPKLVEDRVDEPVLQFVTAQMADPRSFLQRVQYLYEHRQETSQDELALADGRFFDRYSAPMIGSDKRYFGRVWYFRDITERKRAEETLRNAYEYTQQLISSANVMIVGLDATGQVRIFNHAAEKTTGYTIEELAGINWFEKIVPQDRYACVWATFQNYQQKTGEMPTTFENPILTKSGEERFISWQNSTISTPGAEISTISFGIDITESKRAKDALQASEERYHHVLDTMLEGFQIIDYDWRYVYVNETAARQGRSSKEALTGHSMMEMYPGIDNTDMFRILRKCMESRVPGRMENKFIYPNGDIAWFELSIQPSEEGIFILSTNVTERKRTESINMARLRLLQFSATHTLNELLEATLDEAETLTGSLIGFYHFLEADQETLSLQNWSTRTKREFCTAEGMGLHYNVSAAGVWVDCIHQRRPVIHNDYASLSNRKGMPPGHAPVIRELVVPVFRGGNIMAILGVGNKHWDYTSQDVEAVSLLADLAWEIAERKRAEEALHRLNRELRAISNCNQILMRAEDEQTLLNDICRIVCDEAGYRMAWVGYAENDNARTVRPVAWAGVEDGYLATVNITWADMERGQGPGGTVIQSGKPVCVQDISTDPRMLPWRENALQRGYRSGIALPLKDENNVSFGELIIYSTEINAFSPDEIRLLDELAGDLAFGITVLRGLIKRRQAEEKSNQLAAIVQSSDDAIIGKTLRGIVTSWNRGAEKIYGYTESEMIGKPISDLIPPEYESELPQIMIRIEREEYIEHYETVRRRKDGRIINVSLTVSPIYDSSGKVIGASTIARDITERKRAEEALRNSEGRLHTLVQTIPDLIWLKDPDGVYLSCNTMFERFFGASEEAIVGKTDYDFVDRELADSFLESDQKAMAAGKPTSNEEWITFADDGHRVLLETIKTPMYDVQGILIGVLGIGHDITDRKQASERIRNILESTVQAMAVTVETRDPYTAGHQRRVADLARAIATETNLPLDIIEGLRMAASIHDLGKISVPAEILSKPTKLTNIEFMLIKTHSQSGYDILKDIDFPWPLAQIVYQHHERMDGSGYPRNLKGDEIIMEARIMAVADTVEAMASHRPYRPALGIDAALEEIEKNKGIIYDDAVVDACLRLFREKGYQLS